MVKGGIGDLIVAIPLIDSVQKQVGPVKVWTLYPEVYDFLRPDIGAEKLKFPGFDYWLSVETAPRIMLGHKYRRFRSRTDEELYVNWCVGRNIAPGFLDLLNWQPQFDHELALAAVKAGWKRHTLPWRVLGINGAPNPRWAKSSVRATDLGGYITIHDGYDVTQSTVEYRATKSWGLDKWRILVGKVKARFPWINIVQLGSAKSRRIPGVDYDLTGSLSIRQSLNVLASSALHIDGDSGLVHAAWAFGVKSVVMFGPTPQEFFGYDENRNIGPSRCGGCWWLTNTWMDQCPLYASAECMDSVSAFKVAEEAIAALE